MELKQWKKKWLPKYVVEAFDRQGDTSNLSAAKIKVIAKFFNPTGVGDWYAYEYDQENEIFYCFVNLGDPMYAECGGVSLEELASFEAFLGLGIERDRSFEVKTLQEVMDEVKYI